MLADRAAPPLEQVLQVVIMVVIPTQHGQPLPVASHFSSYHAVLATVTSLQKLFRADCVVPQVGKVCARCSASQASGGIFRPR